MKVIVGYARQLEDRTGVETKQYLGDVAISANGEWQHTPCNFGGRFVVQPATALTCLGLTEVACHIMKGRTITLRCSIPQR